MAVGVAGSEGKNAMKHSRFARIARPAISLVMATAGSQAGWMGVIWRGSL